MSNRLALAIALALATALPTSAIEVVASVKPLHSLVAAVMEGTQEPPTLLVEGSNSPHGFALKPSHVEALSRADIVFWIGESYETFLARTLASVSSGATTVKMIEAPGMSKLAFREGGLFESHDEESAGGDDDEHRDESADPHIWLNPKNAVLIVDAVAENLSALDPENASVYQANADATTERIESLEADLTSRLQGLDGSFFFFHDAYHYFEQAFGLEATGTFTIDPSIGPGVQRIEEIKTMIESQDGSCIFAEPQFSPRLVQTLAADTGARLGVLDPLGADLADGRDLYFELMSNLATTFEDCLG